MVESQESRIESEHLKTLKKNASVKEILQTRKAEQLKFLTKNLSLAHINREANSFGGEGKGKTGRGAFEETSKERQERIEHEKEWKKKNFFGGFDSSEGDEASLSYKSDDSGDIPEWKDERNSLNYNQKFRLK